MKIVIGLAWFFGAGGFVVGGVVAAGFFVKEVAHHWLGGGGSSSSSASPAPSMQRPNSNLPKAPAPAITPTTLPGTVTPSATVTLGSPPPTVSTAPGSLPAIGTPISAGRPVGQPIKIRAGGPTRLVGFNDFHVGHNFWLESGAYVTVTGPGEVWVNAGTQNIQGDPNSPGVPDNRPWPGRYSFRPEWIGAVGPDGRLEAVVGCPPKTVLVNGETVPRSTSTASMQICGLHLIGLDNEQEFQIVIGFSKPNHLSRSALTDVSSTSIRLGL